MLYGLRRPPPAHRTPDDDARAISVSFIDPIGTDDLFIQDATIISNDYLGSPGYSSSTLVRENPGDYQERDVVRGLRRLFPGDQIAINPQHVADGKEFVDVLVLGMSYVVVIQAKDTRAGISIVSEGRYFSALFRYYWGAL